MSTLVKMQDKDGTPIDKTNPFPVAVSGSNAKEPFSGSTTVTYTFTQTMRGLVVSNDGASALTFTVNAYTFTVNANEVWDYLLDPFTQVTITTTVAYRCWGRG